MPEPTEQELRPIVQNTRDLCRELIKRPSVTPDDQGCQPMLAERLQTSGFTCEPMRCGDVDNLWARRGAEGPLFVLAGHTDVVPTGDLSAWTHPPFDAVVEGDLLYGRGAADMKGGVAAMITAAERFCKVHPDHRGSLAFLLTSDEEGPAVDGTAKVVERLSARDEHIDYCLLGEPSSAQVLGDTVRHGRRGSTGATLTVHGTQGHVAYPHLADNPVHKALAALNTLAGAQWDNGNEHFPATTFQISNIKAGTGATNVIPATLEVQFNLRFSTELTTRAIWQRTDEILASEGLQPDDYTINWQVSGEPFLTEPAALTDAAIAAIKDICGTDTTLDTGGGTSDGRFIAPTGAQLIELGPCNATIHQIDECVSVTDLGLLSATYENILSRMLL